MSTETDARFVRRILLHVPWCDRPRLKRLVQKILDAKEHNGRKEDSLQRGRGNMRFKGGPDCGAQQRRRYSGPTANGPRTTDH
jgi:hypothetical protein